MSTNAAAPLVDLAAPFLVVAFVVYVLCGRQLGCRGNNNKEKRRAPTGDRRMAEIRRRKRLVEAARDAASHTTDTDTQRRLLEALERFEPLHSEYVLDGGGGGDDDDEFGIPPLEYVNDEAPEKSSIAALGSSGVKDVVDLVSAIGVKSAKIARALLCLMFLVFISNATNK